MTEDAIRDAAKSAEIVTLQTGYDVDVLNREFAVAIVGGRSLIIREDKKGPPQERIQLWNVQTFETWFANRKTDSSGRRTSWGRAWLSDPDRRQYVGVEFTPAPPGKDYGRAGYYNMWHGYEYEPNPKASCAKYLDHIFVNVAHENREVYNWVIGFLAQMIQRPQERVGVSLVLRGRQGCGKTTVGEVVGKLLGSHYTLADSARYLTGQFNAHMANCLLLQCDEGFWAGEKDTSGRLKGLVTSKVQMIEGKGRDPIALPNYIRLMITSNESWIVPAGMEERRFCVLDVSDACAQNGQYFGEIWEELENGGFEALLHYLCEFDLDSVNLREIPRTEALFDQKVQGLPTERAWWHQCLLDGSIMPGEDWPITIDKNYFYNQYQKYCDVINKRGMRMNKGQLSRSLGEILPDEKLISKQVWNEDRTHKTRDYVIPSLEECREVFAEKMRFDVDWGNE